MWMTIFGCGRLCRAFIAFCQFGVAIPEHQPKTYWSFEVPEVLVYFACSLDYTKYIKRNRIFIVLIFTKCLIDWTGLWCDLV